ncbi:hypothetical protein BDR04DRAFT_1102676 [Suillus decipiens]|nr:hypothetical protein BDR04DRAFT_1102676 [Suillus decipiens]
MDHLLLPAGVSPYIMVPYICTESYDGGDFFTYPERKGWAKNIESNDFSRRSPSETNAFFQTWLFFGCLTEVLKAGGVKVDTNEFIDIKSNTVTTKKLQQLISQWKLLWPTSNDVSKQCQCRSYQIYVPDKRCRSERCWQSVVRDRNSAALRTTLLILRTVFRFIDLSGTKETDLAIGEDHPTAPVIPLDPEIVLSISALGSALHQASRLVYESPPGRLSWKGTAIMKERLQRANWCPSRIAGTMDRLGIEGRYYCAANPVKEAGDHSKCSTRRCVAQTIDEDHYPTRHVPGCSCKSAGVPQEELLDIIRQGDEGHTPVVTWLEGNGGMEGRAVVSDASDVNVSSNSNVCRYVAISHVWSQGLGNPAENTLPICQLSQIQQMVDDLFADRGVDEHVPFWMDTLCVPVGENLKEFREKCIIRMRTIYEQATAVLVLDVGMQEVSSSSPIFDRAIAVFQSAWWRRLWTYQDGVLAKQLYIRLSDGVQDLHKIAGEVREHNAELEQQSYTSTELMSMDVSIHFTLGKWRSGEERYVYYLPISGAVSTRSTTRGTDETLCLSTVLGIDPAPFLSIKGLPDQVIDRRMELFLHYIQEFHRGIIFNSLPRLKRDGYRWAPRSLLGHAVGDMGTQYTLADVKHPAYEALLSEDRHGVEVLVVQQYAGMCLEAVVTSHPTTIVVGEGDARYRVQLLLDESSDFSGWNPAAKYNLILSETPGTRLNTCQQEHPVLVDVKSLGVRRIGTMAVLGTRVDQADDLPKVIRIRYVCRAWVTIVEEDQRFDVKGKVLPEESVVWHML